MAKEGHKRRVEDNRRKLNTYLYASLASLVREATHVLLQDIACTEVYR